MTTITTRPFFKTNHNEQTTLYTLRNAQGVEISIVNYGGIIVSILVPDRAGTFADVALGCDTFEAYQPRQTFYGAMIGRCCNRIGKGRFTLSGTPYQVTLSDKGVNHLHGGDTGLDTKLFDAAVKQDSTGDVLCLRTAFCDGEEGYPGNLEVEITCSLSDRNELTLHYTALGDADTLCNLTNHSYFNLAGHNAGTILNHELKLYADYFTEADAESIPTGTILPVEGTPMDFRTFHKLGERIDAEYQPLLNGAGYDHNWILQAGDHQMAICAELYEPASGRLLKCYTDSPCMQMYTGNFINGTQLGKNNTDYPRRAGIALETQYAPDAVNHPDWDSPILHAGDRFDHTTIFEFTTRDAGDAGDAGK